MAGGPSSLGLMFYLWRKDADGAGGAQLTSRALLKILETRHSRISGRALTHSRPLSGGVQSPHLGQSSQSRGMVNPQVLHGLPGLQVEPSRISAVGILLLVIG